MSASKPDAFFAALTRRIYRDDGGTYRLRRESQMFDRVMEHSKSYLAKAESIHPEEPVFIGFPPRPGNSGT